MDENQEILRGKQAHQLLENELLNEALNSLEQKYETAWRNSKLSQVELREEAFRMLGAARELRSYLTNLVNTGKLASTAQAQRVEQVDRERRLSEWDGGPDGQP